MKIFFPALLIAFSTVAMAADEVSAETSATADVKPASFYDKYIVNKLSLGTRVTAFKLLDESRSRGDEFLGHIKELDANQNYAPTKVFADYFFCKHWGFELTWDEVDADAVNRGEEGGVGDADGELQVKGPILTFVGRYPNDTKFTPYAGAGVAFLQGDVDLDDWWHYGYKSKAQYEAAGSPKEPVGRKTRRFVVDDAVGLVLTLGVDYAITKNWSLDLYGRYLQGDMDSTAIVKVGSSVVETVDGTFTVDNVALGLGAKYTF